EGPLMHLPCLVPGSLRGCYEAIIEAALTYGFYPPEVYRDADAAARDHLLRLVETPPHNRYALRTLAWIGDEVVQAAFHRWRNSQPPWYRELADAIGERY